MKTFLSLAAALLSESVFAHDFDVTVGKGGQLKFDPEYIQAKEGDTVTYHFYAKNHAVQQSSFYEPCEVRDGDFFFSGFVPTDSTTVAAPTTFTIAINDTKPIYVYCPQTNGDHCQKGMVQVINPPKNGNTLSAFRDKAAKVKKSSTSPKDGLPVGGQRVLHVDVGKSGELKFSPSDVQELPGTTVQFSFNPKNHTVTQASFDKPCRQLDKGFSSGFIPTSVSPSGAIFDIVIKDTKPIWFYCAQPMGDHCQKGMVGSINAPSDGNTADAFREAAKKAPPSSIAKEAPIGGVLIVNGTTITNQAGNVLNMGGSSDGSSDKNDWVNNVPKPGENNQYMMGMAGGGVISDYGWGKNISDDAVKYLQLLQWFDNILLEALMQGYDELKSGDWSGAWPQTIVDTIGSMGAQAYIHRTTATDTLQHFGKDLAGVCKFELPFDSIDDFLDLVLKVLLLEIGLLLDVIGNIVDTDSWLVSALASSIGSNGRMSAVVNLMQNHIASAAPREVAIPAQFVYSYASSHWISSCPTDLGGWDKPLPSVKVTEKTQNAGSTRVASIRLEFDSKTDSKTKLYAAFLGPWGAMQYAPLSDDKVAQVPTDLYGHVWVVVTKKGEGESKDLWDNSVAGPDLVWISQP